MAEDVDEVRVATSFAVYAAPDGTELPTAVPADAAAYDSDPELDAAFVHLGFTSPDGTTFGDSKTTAKIPVHQRFRGVRTIVTEVASSAAFVLRQKNHDTISLGFGGGEVTEPSPGVYRYDPPPPEEVDRRVIVLDAFDGDIIDRYVIKRGTVSGETRVAFARTSAIDIPITIEADEASDGQAWYLLSNDPAMAESGS